MKRIDHKFEKIPLIFKHCFILMNSNEKYFEEEGKENENEKKKKFNLKHKKKGLFRVSRGKKIIDEYKKDYFEYQNCKKTKKEKFFIFNK